MTILEANYLNKRYVGTTERAVNGFSLKVQAGEIVALLGESGCGKTTILRMIAGFEMPDSGDLYVYGNKVVDATTFVEPEKRHIGLVFQDNALFPHKTVAQNIRFGLYHFNRKEAAKRFKEVIELTGLEGFENRYPHQLSGGQQQRVALARAMAPGPRLILFDEPFSNIDTLLKTRLREEITHILRKTGTTAIFVTHDTKDALTVADQVIVLRHGNTIQQGTPEQIYKSPKNIYVAEFFGKANITKVNPLKQFYTNYLKLPKQSDSSPAILCIRPDAIKVSSQSSNHDLPATILSNKFMGEYNELACSLIIDDEQLELIAYALPNQTFSNGSCFLSIDRDHVHILPD